jgi:hypothetical protein
LIQVLSKLLESIHSLSLITTIGYKLGYV